jgi:hypothetical protein
MWCPGAASQWPRRTLKTWRFLVAGDLKYQHGYHHLAATVLGHRRVGAGHLEGWIEKAAGSNPAPATQFLHNISRMQAASEWHDRGGSIVSALCPDRVGDPKRNRMAVDAAGQPVHVQRTLSHIGRAVLATSNSRCYLDVPVRNAAIDGTNRFTTEVSAVIACSVIRARRLLDHRSRARRQNDNVTGLVQAQVEYAAWLDSLPDSLQDSVTAEALRAICELDVSELQAIIPSRGFGRD